jgi:putative ABC transport system permease protein
VVKGLRRWTLRNALVLGEIALSVVLLTASGLVVRSLLFSRTLPLGFDRQRQLIYFDLLPGIAGYNGQRSAAFFAQVEEKTAALAGVRHAALARRVLLSDSGGGLEQRVSIPGVELPQGQLSIPIKFDTVDGNYFRTVGTRLIAGRDFNSGDIPLGARVTVVSQTMAERFWPGQEVSGTADRGRRDGLPDRGRRRGCKGQQHP